METKFTLTTAIWEFFKKKWVRHVLIIIAILIVWQVTVAVLKKQAEKNVRNIFQPRLQETALLTGGMQAYSIIDSNGLKKLENLTSIMETKKEERKRAFISLYRSHFSASAMLLVLSSLSVVLIFIVAQVGLNHINPYVKTTFFVFAALTSFYNLVPLVYKQESNISKNLTAYLVYDNLQHEVYNFSLTGISVTGTGDTLTMDKFHSNMMNEISKSNNIDFEFNYKVIPIPDYGLSKNGNNSIEINTGRATPSVKD